MPLPGFFPGYQMPVRSSRPCRRNGCRRLCRDGTGYCIEHKPTSGWYEYSRESRHKRGYGTRWDKLRKAVMARDKRICQMCRARGIVTPANQVDHIVPKSQQGTDDIANLQAICTPCHKAKTQAESRGKDYTQTGCTPDGIPHADGHHWGE